MNQLKLLDIPTNPAHKITPADNTDLLMNKHTREHLQDQRALGIYRRRDGWTIEHDGRWTISNGRDRHTSETYMGIWIWWDRWYEQQPNKYYCENCGIELEPDYLTYCIECDHQPNEHEDYEVNWI